MAATPAWAAAIESLLNRGIQSSPEAAALTRRLTATSLRVNVPDMLSIRATVIGSRLLLSRVAESDEGAAETASATITGSLGALLRLAGGTDSRGRDGQRVATPAAQVQGDAEIANLYRQLLNCARPDWEEELSRLVGDMAARRLSRLATGAFDWLRRTRTTAADNIAEYLQEESGLLVTKTELDEFLQGVDDLREVAARIEARLGLLEQRWKSAP
jgi:ubiquinone biosynthesis protein UbiJ